MKPNHLIQFLFLAIIIFGCEKEEEVPSQSLDQNLESAVAEVEQIADVSQFSNRLISAYTKGFQLSASEMEEQIPVTIFAVADNPYWLADTENDVNMVANHIVRGRYEKKDLRPGTVLQTISGQQIKVSFEEFDGSNQDGLTYLNNSVLLEEIADVDGNIIHTVTTPIYCKKEEIDVSIADCKELFKRYVQYLYLFDAILTDESEAINSGWTAIDNHTFNPQNEKIEKLYFDGYHILTRINILDELMEMRHYLNFDPGEDFILQKKVATYPIQSYLYFALVTYFDYIPLLFENVNVQDRIRDFYKLVQKLPSEIYPSIIDKLRVSEELSSQVSIIDPLFSKDAISALLAKVYILTSQYTPGRMILQSLSNSGKYTLENDLGKIYAPNSSETLSGFPKMSDPEFDVLYSNRDFVPLIRYTGSLIDYSYATINEGLLVNSKTAMDMIHQRRGLDGVALESMQQMKGVLFEIISREIKKEGVRFMYLKLFNKAEEVIHIQAHQKLLPIPQRQLLINPYFQQNPGY